MKKTIQIAKAFIKLFYRDPANVFFTFFFNAFLMVMLGWMVQSRTQMNMTIGIYDELNTNFSNGFVATLNTGSITTKKYTNLELMRRDVKNGDLTMALDLKPDFEHLKCANFFAKNQSGKQLVIYGNSSKEMWVKMMNMALRTGFLKYNGNTSHLLDYIHIEETFIQSRDLSYFAFMFPGILVFTIMGLSFSGCTTLLYYREKDTLKRLKISPVSKSEFLTGFVLSYLAFLIIQTVFYIIIGWLLFGYVFKENLIQVSMIILLTGILFMAIGLFIINLSKSSDIGNNIIRFLNFPASFLCGVFLPVAALPKTMQYLAYCHPLTYVVKAIQGAGNLSWSVTDNLMNYIIMFVLTVLFIILAIKTFVWEEQTA